MVSFISFSVFQVLVHTLPSIRLVFIIVKSYTAILFTSVRFLFVEIVVGRVKSFLSTVGNALVKDEYVQRKILKSKSLLELAQAAFSGLLGKVMLGQEGTWWNFAVNIFKLLLVIDRKSADLVVITD